MTYEALGRVLTKIKDGQSEGSNVFYLYVDNGNEIGQLKSLSGNGDFQSKTALVIYYQKAWGAEILFGQIMYIDIEPAEKLINQYFKN